MEIVIFGTGAYWNNRKKYILDACDIVCFLDNDSSKWDKTINGINIIQPEKIVSYQFDYVVIMCKSDDQVRRQLENIGISSSRIITYNQLRQICLREYYIQYGMKNDKDYDVVIISTALNYNGGTIAAVYAAKALQKREKRVLVCSEDCNSQLLGELLADNMEILIAPSLPYIINTKLTGYIKKSKMVLVNVFQMLPVVCQLNGIKPVLWWIHEPSDLYTPVLQEFNQYKNSEMTSYINCIAVSGIPQKNFKEKYFKTIYKTMPYGIPDLALLKKEYEKINNKIIFAIVGAVVIRKAQDVFIDAIEKLNQSELEKTEFYIIGAYGNDEFGEKILQRVSKFNNIHMLGNLRRLEMERAYPKIDVVVCPSREDPLPIVMTEAMMYRKPCIASDSTGTADYIKDGINGFVCKTEDSEDLCEKMRYFIHHQEKIEIMGKEARKVYEEYFTMDKFADRLCNQMQKTIDMFNEKKMEELCR